MTVEMLERVEAEKLVDGWLSGAEENPAGPLYTGGDFAVAEIITATIGGSGRCGTVCSGSRTNPCC